VPKRLPTKLKHEPLVDAVCEIRVGSKVDLHTILPGLMYAGLKGIGKIEEMPALQIPEQLRVGRPEFSNANSSLMRLHWGDYFITIGTRNVFVGPKLPYQGWPAYRSNILEVFQLLLKNSFVESIERYSIKYVNLVPGSELIQQNSVLDWDVRIGPNRINQQTTQIRTELRDDPFLTIIQMSTGIEIEMVETKESKKGSLVDVDTLCLQAHSDVAQFSAELPNRLDAIRHHNKITFFDCLQDSTIQAMEPSYE
jgi:uncharacterized protein (TIGR04255 family)